MDAKKLERYLFDEFTRLNSDFPLLFVDQPTPPQPDILADFQGMRIGVEITRHLWSSVKEKESKEDKVIERARRTLKKLDARTVGVSVHFTSQSVTGLDHNAVGDAIGSLVAQNIPPWKGMCEIEGWPLLEPLASSLHSLTIERFVDYPESHWRVPRGGFFPDLENNVIKEIIRRKELRLNGYRRFCNEVWLLIASESGAPSSWWELPNKACQEIFTTSFDRVFILTTLPKKVVQLQIQKRNHLS